MKLGKLVFIRQSTKMKTLNLSDYFQGKLWSGWHRWGTWSTCIGVLILLGAFRKQTDAEFALATLALFPVLAIAWLGGKQNGLILAFLAAAMWGAGDLSSARPFSASWIPWANAVTHFVTYGLVAILAAQVRLQFEREHKQATRDALTGLQNRRAFLEAGAIETERSKRYAHPLTVIFLDLDDFKKLNDAKGHQAGDAALKITAEALLSALRTNDYVARLGGDEFAVMLPETGYDEAVETGRKILVSVNNTLLDYPPVGASIGVACFGEVDRTFPEMLKAADELMYEVKESGKHNMRTRHFSTLN
jgi:diguanylate cyclase (GGDEF)-like protein